MGQIQTESGPAVEMKSAAGIVRPRTALLHGLPPPGGLLIAQELRLRSPRKVEVQNFPFLKRGAFRPGGLVLVQVSLRLVIVYQRDIRGRTLDDLLGLEGKRSAGRRIGRYLIGNLRQQQNEHKRSRKNGNFFHGDDSGQAPLQNHCPLRIQCIARPHNTQARRKPVHGQDKIARPSSLSGQSFLMSGLNASRFSSVLIVAAMQRGLVV